MQYLGHFVAVIGGLHWTYTIQMRCMLATWSDQQAVFLVFVDAVHNHSKSISLRKNSLVK